MRHTHLQDEFLQVCILLFVFQMFRNIALVDHYVDSGLDPVRVEGNIVKQVLHDRMQPTRADVFCVFIDDLRKFRNLFERIDGKFQSLPQEALHIAL